MGFDLAKPKKSLFYGWKIVIAIFWINTLLFGAAYIFGVFFKSLEADFHMSRAVTSSIVSISWVITAGVAVLGGWAFERFGPRLVLIMAFITGLSLLLTSQVHDIWQLFITYSFLLALGTGALYVVCMPLLFRWFEQKRGLATGIALAGSSFGQVVFAPLATFIIVKFDWRIGFLVLGLIAWLAIPLSLILKEDPREIGLLPDGRQSNAGVIPDTTEVPYPSGFSILEVLKTRNFWLLTALHFMFGVCALMVAIHIVPHVIDIGFSAGQGATVISIIGMLSFTGFVLGGILTDRVGAKTTVILFSLGMGVMTAWLAHITGLWQIYLFAALYGLASGGITPSLATFFGQTFGMTHLSKILGMIEISWAIGAAIGPFIGGALFDINGNYVIAFLVAAIAMMIVALMAVLVRRPPPLAGGR
jgi:MFS family permease